MAITGVRVVDERTARADRDLPDVVERERRGVASLERVHIDAVRDRVHDGRGLVRAVLEQILFARNER